MLNFHIAYKIQPLHLSICKDIKAFNIQIMKNAWKQSSSLKYKST